MQGRFRFAGLGENPNYFKPQTPQLGQTTDWNQDGVPDAQQEPPPQWPTEQYPWPPPSDLEAGQYPPGYVPPGYVPPENGVTTTNNAVSAWPHLPIIGNLPPIIQLLVIAGAGWWLWTWWRNRDDRPMEDYIG